MRLFFEVSKDLHFSFRKMLYFYCENRCNMDINSLTASKIKELRLETGKSQVDIAKEMGISPSAYERLENGKVDINLKSLELVAKYYNLNVSELITQKNATSYHCENSNAINIQSPNSTVNFNFSEEDAEKMVEIVKKYFGGKNTKK